MKSAKIIIGIAIVATIIGIVCLTVPKSEPSVTTNVDSIFASSTETGFISEKIVGDPDAAELTIYEYADYSCPHCADWNKIVNDLMEKYDGRIALVFRSYDIGQFKNSPVAARAATAAQIQGYFKEYKDLLFANQAEWVYAKATQLDGLFSGYFEKVSNDAGDLDKFKEDMTGDSVQTRLDFEQNLGKSAGLTGTPTFRINGRSIGLDKLVETIEALLSWYNENG